ncbi:MAG: nuclear transport factor 2 family protein [Inhella sp.]
MPPITLMFRAARPAAALALALPSAHASVCADPAQLPQLQSLADAIDARWNARDAAGLAGFYGPRATLSLEPSAVRLSGRAEVQRYFERSLGGLLPELRHVTQVQRASELPEGLCLTDSAVFLEREAADGTRSRVAEFRTYTLLRAQGSGWDVLAVRAVALGRPAPRS